MPGFVVAIDIRSLYFLQKSTPQAPATYAINPYLKNLLDVLSSQCVRSRLGDSSISFIAFGRPGELDINTSLYFPGDAKQSGDVATTVPLMDISVAFERFLVSCQQGMTGPVQKAGDTHAPVQTMMRDAVVSMVDHVSSPSHHEVDQSKVPLPLNTQLSFMQIEGNLHELPTDLGVDHPSRILFMTADTVLQGHAARLDYTVCEVYSGTDINQEDLQRFYHHIKRVRGNYMVCFGGPELFLSIQSDEEQFNLSMMHFFKEMQKKCVSASYSAQSLLEQDKRKNNQTRSAFMQMLAYMQSDESPVQLPRICFPMFLQDRLVLDTNGVNLGKRVKDDAVVGGERIVGHEPAITVELAQELGRTIVYFEPDPQKVVHLQQLIQRGKLSPDKSIIVGMYPRGSLSRDMLDIVTQKWLSFLGLPSAHAAKERPAHRVKSPEKNAALFAAPTAANLADDDFDDFDDIDDVEAAEVKKTSRAPLQSSTGGSSNFFNREDGRRTVSATFSDAFNGAGGFVAGVLGRRL